MDKKTRGFVEKSLDAVLKTNITDGMRWIVDESPIKSPEELALGYVLGSLTRLLHDTVRTKRILLKRKKALNLTENDVTEIRDMLRRRLPDIREKIARELYR